MITASHNPAQDNGYKVYCKPKTLWQLLQLTQMAGSTGVQIIPPHDAGIAKRIEENLHIADEVWNTTDLRALDLCLDRTEELQAEYIASISRLCTSRSVCAFCIRFIANVVDSDIESTSKTVRFAYTPMHGVGLPFAKSALSAIGFPAETMHVVDTQAQPDPDFPTVKFPNPEEKGALDEAIAAADAAGIMLICANDPDADRFCAAEKRE